MGIFLIAYFLIGLLFVAAMSWIRDQEHVQINWYDYLFMDVVYCLLWPIIITWIIFALIKEDKEE